MLIFYEDLGKHELNRERSHAMLESAEFVSVSSCSLNITLRLPTPKARGREAVQPTVNPNQDP